MADRGGFNRGFGDRGGRGGDRGGRGGDRGGRGRCAMSLNQRCLQYLMGQIIFPGNFLILVDVATQGSRWTQGQAWRQG